MGWVRFASGLLAGAAFALPPAVGAVSAPNQPRCTVVGKLPAAVGGSGALCAAVERAVATRAPDARFTAVVKVSGNAMLSTSLVVNGRALPEHKFAVMDRRLDKSSIERFAAAIASAVARAAKA